MKVRIRFGSVLSIRVLRGLPRFCVGPVFDVRFCDGAETKSEHPRAADPVGGGFPRALFAVQI